jgi:cation diffusion facilitator family transporter
MIEQQGASSKDHAHEHKGPHRHTHGVIDPTLAATERGIWALKWSFIGLFVTALFQVVVVYYSGSVALLADTIHNFGDAATAIPLWIAFVLARRKPSRQFTYGLGRVEDLAGITIVMVILLSAILAGYHSFQRLIHPQPVEYLWAVILASVIGFTGNEAVAVFRIRVGKEINSAALVADGYHARVDGLTSLAVLLGAIGVSVGYPLADPFIGLVITSVILKIVWDSSKAVFSRLLDGIEPKIIDDLKHAADHIQEVRAVSEVRGRWLGHRLSAELNITVQSELSVGQAHAVALEVRHHLMHQLSYLSNVTIHVDPEDVSGEDHHRIQEHSHDGLQSHSHK